MSNVQIQGHRGASGYAPENTLPSFRLASDMGANGIECDIHLSKDGHFVVCHDESIDRTSDGVGAIANLTLAEIQARDFGKKFSDKFQGVRAPTLEEMLDVVKHMNPVNIEIKNFGQGDAAVCAIHQFYGILERFGILSNTIVSSFNAPLLKKLKQLHPDVYTCLLYSKRRRPAAYAQSIGCSAIHPNQKLLTRATVNSAHKRGLKVNSWTVNEEADIRRMIAIGCDGLITNYPDIALKIAREE